MMEQQLVSFGNFLLKGAKNRPEEVETQVTHADLCNWRDQSDLPTNVLPSSLQIGDAARVSFLRQGAAAMVTKVHFSPSKVMYDFEISYPNPEAEGEFIRTRIHNIDSALVSTPPQG